MGRAFSRRAIWYTRAPASSPCTPEPGYSINAPTKGCAPASSSARSAPQTSGRLATVFLNHPARDAGGLILPSTGTRVVFGASRMAASDARRVKYGVVHDGCRSRQDLPISQPSAGRCRIGRDAHGTTRLEHRWHSASCLAAARGARALWLASVERRLHGTIVRTHDGLIPFHRLDEKDSNLYLLIYNDNCSSPLSAPRPQILRSGRRFADLLICGNEGGLCFKTSATLRFVWQMTGLPQACG